MSDGLRQFFAQALPGQAQNVYRDGSAEDMLAPVTMLQCEISALDALNARHQTGLPDAVVIHIPEKIVVSAKRATEILRYLERAIKAAETEKARHDSERREWELNAARRAEFLRGAKFR